MGDFRFQCVRGCTNCCCSKGFVYLTEDDLRRAAAHLDMSVRDFEKKFVYRTRHQLRLRKPPSRECPFLESAGCALHPAKPTQCRAFPFWPELVEDRDAWRAAARSCPGIGRGALVTIDTARRIAGEMRDAYPGMYR